MTRQNQVDRQSCEKTKWIANNFQPLVQVFGGSGVKVPVKEISISGATQMLAMASSNEALRYVSYPTQVRSCILNRNTVVYCLSTADKAMIQVLGKSCKMVPVFLFSILIGTSEHTNRLILAPWEQCRMGKTS